MKLLLQRILARVAKKREPASKTPSSTSELYKKAAGLWLDKDIEGSLEVFYELLLIDPLHRKSHLSLARMYFVLDNYYEHDQHILLAGMPHSEHPEAHSKIGMVLLYRMKIDSAVEHFVKALDLDPAYAPAYSHLGIAMLVLGKTDKAGILFRRAMNSNHRWHESYWCLASILAQRGYLNSALTVLRRAIRYAPESQRSKGYFLVAKTLKEMGMEERAEHYLWKMRICEECGPIFRN